MAHTYPLIEDLIDRLGHPATQQIVAALGGTRCYIPNIEALSAGHPLAQTLGEPLAAQLCQHYASELIELPTCAQVFKRHRNQQIWRDHLQGASSNQLARRYQLTQRMVRYIIARQRQHAPASLCGNISAAH